MTPVSLEAFLHEYRTTFPVGVDQPGQAALPTTMGRYGLRGTPSLLLLDRGGILAAHRFGQISALKLGAEIMSMIIGGTGSTSADSASGMNAGGRGSPSSPFRYCVTGVPITR